MYFTCKCAHFFYIFLSHSISIAYAWQICSFFCLHLFYAISTYVCTYVPYYSQNCPLKAHIYPYVSSNSLSKPSISSSYTLFHQFQNQSNKIFYYAPDIITLFCDVFNRKHSSTGSCTIRRSFKLDCCAHEHSSSCTNPLCVPSFWLLPVIV